METIKTLFVLNSLSGTKDTDYKQEIVNHFDPLPQFDISFIEPDWSNDPAVDLENELANNTYDIVIASGGDGTIRFVAQILYGRNITMGIIPTGSSNGLAKNLLLDKNLINSFTTIQQGKTMRVSSLTVNDKFCIHIADIGMNAAIVRRFEQLKRRGILGYLQAFMNVAFDQKSAKASVVIDGKELYEKFYMLVFANGTGYGTGLPINPNGRLDDEFFELIKVEKISFPEAFRMYLGKEKPHPDVASIISCRHVKVKTKKPVHLQVDGEYIGKTKEIDVHFNEKFIDMIVPETYLNLIK